MVTNEIGRQVAVKTFTYSDTLKLDFYSDTTITAKNRPLILFLHGGGFSGGKRDNPNEIKFCKSLTENGFVVVSMSYRLTRKGKSFGCDCPSEEKIKTFVAAAEDIGKALEFLISREETLFFDSKKIVLAGSSAGAEAVLNYAFLTSDYRFRHIKKYPLAGVIAFAGAVLNANYITENNLVPVLFFHGKKDNLVPYGTSPHHYCKPESEGYLILNGPETIVERLKGLNGSYYLAYDPEGNHDWANLAFDETALNIGFIEKVIVADKAVQKSINLKSRRRK